MPRNVGTERPEDWAEYTPEIDNNRDDPSPLTVELLPLSAEDYRRYTHSPAAVLRKAVKDPLGRADAIMATIFSERVRNVRNYSVNGRPITTGAELFRFGEPEVVDDVSTALKNASSLSAGLQKKSNSPSASLRAATPIPGAGAALDAKAPSTAIKTGFESTATVTACTRALSSDSSGHQG